MVRLVINGKEAQTPDGLTVLEVLEERKDKWADMVLVKLNGQLGRGAIVRRRG